MTPSQAHYAGLSKAKTEATRLNGTTFKGRTIHAKFQMPSLRQTESFTVILEGLPPLLPSDSAQLKALAHANHIAIGKPTYIKQVAIDRIRDLLTGYGHLDSFDVMPMSQSNTKMTAWVQFVAAEDAARAVDKLHDSRQYFIRNGPLWLEQIHAVRYLLSRAQFTVLRSIIDRLSATTDGCCQLRYYEHGEGGTAVDPVCVRIYGPDAKSLTWTKRALEKAIQGRRLTDSDGAVVWHDFFTTVRGKDLVDEVQGQTSTFIKCDPRLREVRICGEEQSIECATKQFLVKNKELSSQKRVIEVQKNWLKPLLSGGLRDIQEDFGEGTLLFDVVARTISVRGDDHTVMSVRRAIDRLVAKQVSNREANSDAEEVCPVCFCETSDSTTLPCGHVYDIDCLRHLLKASIDTTSFNFLLCVKEEDDGKTCATLIPLSIIRDVLSPDEESRLFDASFRSYVNSRPHDFHYCPTVDCPTIYRPGREGTVLLCPSCLERICPNCHTEYHEGLTCKEFKSGISEDTEMFNAWKFNAWKAENGVKSCPGCDADIQKNGGCNHIRCTVCKIHICWVCMMTFKDDDDGESEGVYPHMKAAHGGYGS